MYTSVSEDERRNDRDGLRKFVKDNRSRVMEASAFLQGILGLETPRPPREPILEPHHFPRGLADTVHNFESFDGSSLESNDSWWAVPNMSKDYEMDVESIATEEEESDTDLDSSSSDHDNEDQWSPTTQSLSPVDMFSKHDSRNPSQNIGLEVKPAIYQVPSTPHEQMIKTSRSSHPAKSVPKSATSFSSLNSFPSQDEARTPTTLFGSPIQYLLAPLSHAGNESLTQLMQGLKVPSSAFDEATDISLSLLHTADTLSNSSISAYSPQEMTGVVTKVSDNHESFAWSHGWTTTEAESEDEHGEFVTPFAREKPRRRARPPQVVVSHVDSTGLACAFSLENHDSSLFSTLGLLRLPEQGCKRLFQHHHISKESILPVLVAATVPKMTIELSSQPLYWISEICKDINYWLQAADSNVQSAPLQSIMFGSMASTTHLACNKIVATRHKNASMLRMLRIRLPKRARALLTPELLDWLIFDVRWFTQEQETPFIVLAIPEQRIVDTIQQAGNVVLQIALPGRVPVAHGQGIDPRALDEFMTACAQGIGEIRAEVIGEPKLA